MSVLATAGPRTRRSRFRAFFPWVVLGLGIGGVALLWSWPDPEWEEMWRVVGTLVLVPLTGLLLLVWLLFLSNITKTTRRIVLVLLLAAALGTAAAVREVHFSGHMWPIIVWRWSKTVDEALEEHRLSQKPDALAPLLLTDLPTDFPAYRGRRRDGVVTGPVLAREWHVRPPRLLWKQPVGGGYAAFAVAGNLAVTIEQRRDKEAIVAYDTTSGGERWSYSYPALFKERMGGNGPRATPTLDDGQVFSLGATGMLVCLDAATGKRKWEVDILEDNENLPWGMSGSPLVCDRYVVVSPGKQAPGGHTLVAYERDTGKKAWATGEARGGYSSPMLLDSLAGVRQIVLLDGQGLAGYDPATGRQLWRSKWETNQGINVAQPVILEGDRIFIASGYGVGCALIQIKQENGKLVSHELWHKRAMRCKFTSPVGYRGYLYGLDEGILECIDDKTGEPKWREGRYEHGQVLLSGDVLLILAESGDLAMVEASPASYRELGRISVFEGKTWNCPALANGKAYLRNDQEMACYDLTGEDRQMKHFPSNEQKPQGHPRGNRFLLQGTTPTPPGAARARLPDS